MQKLERKFLSDCFCEKNKFLSTFITGVMLLNKKCFWNFIKQNRNNCPNILLIFSLTSADKDIKERKLNQTQDNYF